MGLHTPWQKLGRSVTKMLDHNNYRFPRKTGENMVYFYQKKSLETAG